MGLYRGPNSTDDGLVFAIDFLNTKSYSSGNTVRDIVDRRDLVKKKDIGTFSGTYSDGYVNFNGSQDGTFKSPSLHTDLFSGSPSGITFTIEIWFLLETDNTGVGFFSNNPNGDWTFIMGQDNFSIAGWHLFFQFNDTPTAASSGTLEGVRTDNNFTTDGNWHQFVVTRTPGVGNSNFNIYLDGVNDTNTTGSNTFDNIGTDTIPDVSYDWKLAMSNTFYMDGNIAMLKIWNRALSQEEVTNNWNFHKNRFGY